MYFSVLHCDFRSASDEQTYHLPFYFLLGLFAREKSCGSTLASMTVFKMPALAALVASFRKTGGKKVTQNYKIADMLGNN